MPPRAEPSEGVTSPETLEMSGRIDAAMILAEMVNDRRVAVPIADLARRLRVGQSDLGSAIAEAEAAGLAQRWDQPKVGPCLTLTPLMAARLGVGPNGSSFKWQAASIWNDPLPPPYGNMMTETDATRDPTRGDAMEGASRPFDMREDPRAASPLLHAVASEISEQGAARVGRELDHLKTRRYVPKYAYGWVEEFLSPCRLVLGLGIPWPAVAGPDEPCPGCLGRELGHGAVCLICHRSGIDHLLQPIPKAHVPKPYVSPAERKTRKERRRGRPRKAG